MATKTKRRKFYTDTERLDWLAKQQGSALVSDDHSHWAVSGSGMQNVPTDPPQDISTTFFVEKQEWKSAIWRSSWRRWRHEVNPSVAV